MSKNISIRYKFGLHAFRSFESLAVPNSINIILLTENFRVALEKLIEKSFEEAQVIDLQNLSMNISKYEEIGEDCINIDLEAPVK